MAFAIAAPLAGPAAPEARAAGQPACPATVAGQAGATQAEPKQSGTSWNLYCAYAGRTDVEASEGRGIALSITLKWDTADDGRPNATQCGLPDFERPSPSEGVFSALTTSKTRDAAVEWGGPVWAAEGLRTAAGALLTAVEPLSGPCAGTRGSEAAGSPHAASSTPRSSAGTTPAGDGTETREVYYAPDIEWDHFCDGHLPAVTCRCAHDGVDCADAGMTKLEASTYVRDQYLAWIHSEIEAFARACMADGGIWNQVDESCTHCAAGFVPYLGKCALEGSQPSIEELYDLMDPDLEAPTAVAEIGLVTRPEGEVFVYSAVWQKWQGPVTGDAPIHEGDIVLTRAGSALLKIWGPSRRGHDWVTVVTNTIIEFPVPSDPAPTTFWGTVRQGIIDLFHPKDTNKSPFNVRTPMIMTGTRGTDVVVGHDATTGQSSVTLNEGAVDVWFVDDPSSVVSLSPGNAVRTEQDTLVPYAVSQADWEALLNANGFPIDKSGLEAEPFVVFDSPPVDPDLIYPAEAALDLVGELDPADFNIPEPAGDGDAPVPGVVGLVLIVVVAGGGLLYVRRSRQPAQKES